MEIIGTIAEPLISAPPCFDSKHFSMHLLFVDPLFGKDPPEGI